jgi:AraC family transcriptional regulator
MQEILLDTVPTAPATGQYLARFRRVLDFIEANLDAELDVERLAAVAMFSKFHFHRQFSILFGMGVGRYVQLLRLKRAAEQLAYRRQNLGQNVLDVALANGFDSPEAFARAFKKATGQTPTEFRERPEWISWQQRLEPLETLRREHMPGTPMIDDVEIVNFPETRVAALDFRGDLRLMGDAIRQFIDWRQEHRLPPAVSDTFNIVYHHSDNDDEPSHYAICAATTREIAANDAGIAARTIPAGRCARLTHKGVKASFPAHVAFLYSYWLPQSGAEPRDFPLFFKRVKFFPDVPESEAVTEIYLPLEDA